MRRQSLVIVAAVPLLLAGLAACGEDAGDRAEDAPAAEGPTTLQPADTGSPVPKGFERRECELTAEDRSLTVLLDVPVGAEPPEDRGDAPSNSCWFFPQADGVPEVHVVLLHDTAEANDEDDIASLEDLEAGFDERVGEEAVDNVDYQRRVVVFGETVGDRLTWTSEYEGIPEWNFRSEADGVQVWLTAQGEEFDGTEMERVFDSMSASVGVR